MRNVIKAALLAHVLALAVPVMVQDDEAGFEAYQRGDNAAALSVWRPLAVRGDDSARLSLSDMRK